MTDPKATLRHHLQAERDAMLGKLDGLEERQVRWPMTPTGTNLLGLVKHLAYVELDYFGDTFGFPSPVPMPDVDADPNADMFATAEESREEIIRLYRRAWAHSDATIAELDLDSIGRVPWWPEEHAAVTLHQVLVRVAVETARHAGHADIIRELHDGAVGWHGGGDNIPDGTDWPAYVARLEAIAERF